MVSVGQKSRSNLAEQFWIGASVRLRSGGGWGGAIAKAYSLTCLAPVLGRHSSWGLEQLGHLVTLGHLSASVWFLHIVSPVWWFHGKWTSYVVAQGSEGVVSKEGTKHSFSLLSPFITWTWLLHSTAFMRCGSCHKNVLKVKGRGSRFHLLMGGGTAGYWKSMRDYRHCCGQF